MRTLSSTVLVLLLVAACDSGKKASPAPDDAAAKAAEPDDTDKKLEERRKAREAKAAADAKAAEDRKVKIDELCTVPADAKKPKKLDAACDAMAEAQIAFLRRMYTGDAAKLEGVEKNAPMQKANILKMCTTMDVAVGLKNAFDNAPEGYGESMNDIVAVCLSKLGDGEAGAAVALPAKKPG